MNSNDVYQKSNLGREEIRGQSLSVLPREARTLLLMIDGEKTYQSYIDSLNENKMFAEFGGGGVLFKLLLEFQCIELTVQSSVEAAEQATAAVNQPQLMTSTPPEALPESESKVLDNQNSNVAQPQTNGLQSVASQPAATQPNSEAEFAADFHNISSGKESNQESSKGGYFISKEPDGDCEMLKSELANYSFITEEFEGDCVMLKSDLATHIEKNASPQDVWGYLLNLEQCEDDTQLLALVQKIQSSASGKLSRGMDEFSKKIKRHL